jgi:hypothetical protein
MLSTAVDSDGTLAIAWSDASSAGIDIHDSAGISIRTINTGKYVPRNVSFGPDHTLWSLGMQRDAEPYKAGGADYKIVRKYSLDGKETGAYLPRSLFLPGLPPALVEWQKRKITVTSDRVGMEVVSGNVGNQTEWVELDLNGNLTGRWKLEPHDEFPGVTLTSDGQAYLQRIDRHAKLRPVFRLNRITSIWEPVDTPDAQLYGTDGEYLVFAKWSDGTVHLGWYPQPSRD